MKSKQAHKQRINDAIVMLVAVDLNLRLVEAHPPSTPVLRIILSKEREDRLNELKRLLSDWSHKSCPLNRTAGTLIEAMGDLYADRIYDLMPTLG